MTDKETVSMGEAARIVGRSKGTLSKAIAAGRLPVVEQTKNGYLIDVAVLADVFPERASKPTARSSSFENGAHDDGEGRYLRRELDALRAQLDDMRADRDAWREQAQRLSTRS